MTWRIRDRQTFLELRRQGRRARSGSVTVTFLADSHTTDPQPSRIAFAVPRKVGNSVQRNRVRRVVRGRLEQRRRTGVTSPGAGAYLIAVRPTAAGLEPASIADEVEACLDELGSPR